MEKSSIKDSLARNGFVFTDLDSGVRITARGPKTPAGPGTDGERDTVVRAVKDGVDVEHSTHRSRGAAAGRYVELVDEYSTADA
jgi:hypothetical protein